MRFNILATVYSKNNTTYEGESVYILDSENKLVALVQIREDGFEVGDKVSVTIEKIPD